MLFHAFWLIYTVKEWPKIKKNKLDIRLAIDGVGGDTGFKPQHRYVTYIV